jgi:hypothetical protein
MRDLLGYRNSAPIKWTRNRFEAVNSKRRKMENEIVRVAGGGGETERDKPRSARKHNRVDEKSRRRTRQERRRRVKADIKADKSLGK